MPGSKQGIKRTVDIRITISLIVAAVLIGGAGYLFFSSNDEAISTSAWVNHTYDVLGTVNEMYGNMREAEASQRNYLLTLTPSSLSLYNAARQETYDYFKRLQSLTTDNPIQQTNLNDMRRIIDTRFRALDTGISIRRQQGLNAALEYVSQGIGTTLMTQVTDEVSRISSEERELLRVRQQQAAESAKNTRAALLALVGLALLLIFSVYYFFRRDITERAKAERERDRFFNVSPDIFCILSDDLTIIRGNPAWQSVLGYDQEDIRSKPFTYFVHPEYIQTVTDAFSSTNTQTETEVPVRKKDGVYRWIEMRGRTFREEGLIFANARDVTARRQAEAEMRVINERLRASNRELEDFASIASHDLQEPLRKIQSFADIVTTRFKPELSEPAQSYVEKMQQAATRMRLLIDNMLSYSRVTSRAQKLQRIRLRDVVDGVLSDLETAITQRDAEIEIGELPEIEADAFQMHQLFQNLIGNGLKFQRQDVKPVITVRQRPIEKKSRKQDFVAIEVSDNGIGFEQEYAEKVFGMFQRLHGRQEYEGTGIGLAVCRKIVERHHGTIAANSKVGVGTTFEIILPKNQNIQYLTTP